MKNSKFLPILFMALPVIIFVAFMQKAYYPMAQFELVMTIVGSIILGFIGYGGMRLYRKR